MIRCPAAGLVAILVMIASPVLAQDASGNLVGTWTMTDFIGRSWNGTKISSDTFKSFELEI